MSAPGSYHDAAVWEMSRIKAWVETHVPRRSILADSAYPQTDVLMTPYPENQARNDDSKCLYNVRHSSSRMEMLECIYGEKFVIRIYIEINQPGNSKQSA